MKFTKYVFRINAKYINKYIIYVILQKQPRTHNMPQLENEVEHAHLRVESLSAMSVGFALNKMIDL